MLDRLVVAEHFEDSVREALLAEISSLRSLPASAIHRLDLTPVARSQYMILARDTVEIVAYARERRAFFVEKEPSSPSRRLAKFFRAPAGLRPDWFVYDPSAGLMALFRRPYRIYAVTMGIARIWSPPLTGTNSFQYRAVFWMSGVPFTCGKPFSTPRRALSFARTLLPRVEEIWNMGSDISNWSVQSALNRVRAARYRGISRFLEASAELDLNTMFQPLAARIPPEPLPDRKSRAYLRRWKLP